jgi:four helix bundle protein
MLRGYKDLKVYQAAFRLAMEIFQLSKIFPTDERYSLTSQIRCSSRSVAANLAEGFRKRQYANMFVSKLADCDAEAAETQVWLDCALESGYVSGQDHKRLISGYEEVGRMLGQMMREPERFSPNKSAKN